MENILDRGETPSHPGWGTPSRSREQQEAGMAGAQVGREGADLVAPQKPG